jgi:TPR repeat protein
MRRKAHIVSADSDDPEDAIAYLTGIDENTWTITVELDGEEIEWRVARRNPNTKAPTTFADAFEAINSLSLEYNGDTEPEAVPFEFKPDYVRSIYGRKNAIFPLGWWITSRTGAEGSEEDINPKVSPGKNARIQFDQPTRSQYGSPENGPPEESLRFAKRWIELAEISDDPFPKFMGGVFLIDLDPKRALDFIQYAAGKGEPEASVLLGLGYLRGQLGLKKDSEKAKSHFQEAAKKGNAHALYWLGSSEQDTQLSVQYLKRGAEMGDAECLHSIGNLYAMGFSDLPKDTAKAIELWKIAVERGHTNSLVFLGAVYVNGLGVDRDEAKGVEFWRKGHESGDPESSFMLGNAYREGRGGLVKDTRKALELIRHSADNGFSSAMLELSRAYLAGFGGLIIDERKSLEYLKMAAEKGNVEAMVELAGEYVDGGLGLDSDEKSAVFWYKRAAECGYELSNSEKQLIERQSGVK